MPYVQKPRSPFFSQNIKYARNQQIKHGKTSHSLSRSHVQPENLWTGRIAWGIMTIIQMGTCTLCSIWLYSYSMYLACRTPKPRSLFFSKIYNIAANIIRKTSANSHVRTCNLNVYGQEGLHGNFGKSSKCECVYSAQNGSTRIACASRAVQKPRSPLFSQTRHGTSKSNREQRSTHSRVRTCNLNAYGQGGLLPRIRPTTLMAAAFLQLAVAAPCSCGLSRMVTNEAPSTILQHMHPASTFHSPSALPVHSGVPPSSPSSRLIFLSIPSSTPHLPRYLTALLLLPTVEACRHRAPPPTLGCEVEWGIFDGMYGTEMPPRRVHSRA